MVNWYKEVKVVEGNHKNKEVFFEYYNYEAASGGRGPLWSPD